MKLSFSYNETRIGQGRENAKNFLRENKDILNEVEIAIRQKLGIPSPNTPEGSPSSEAAQPETKKKSKKED